MTEALLKGLTFGLWLSLAVGPVLFSIIKQSLNNGYRGGIAFVLGVFASDVLLVLVSNIFSEFFNRVSGLQKEIAFVGSVFLITLGIYFLFFKKTVINDNAGVMVKFRKRDYARISLSGFFMNLLNPGVFVFWIYASSVVVSQTTNHRIIVFVTCLLWVLSTDLLKVFLADKIRNRLTPKNIHIINRLNGAILLGFGAVLLWGVFFYK
ncbi:LysE family translocator [Terrimonas rubra]|uniref:LysE family translocator n=1 Tax=Terrimonas rubra TaxID=1035890 RepID=A0ABW6A120_9BACT